MASQEIIPVKLKPILLEKLHIRYIPFVTPIDMWNYDMSLINSPHVELCNIFATNKLDWKEIRKSRYYKERVRRWEIGMKRWTTEKIESHIVDRYKIFRSIKKHGFKKRLVNADPIYVLKEPFWRTRFGLNENFLGGYEIWNGAGRCAALHVLGVETINVLISKDANPGSCDKGTFASKLKGVKEVWA